jgi:hypothetical protein
MITITGNSGLVLTAMATTSVLTFRRRNEQLRICIQRRKRCCLSWQWGMVGLYSNSLATVS